MKPTDNANARPSDATSNARLSDEAIDPLEREADLARAALALKFQELKASLQTAADPREWVSEHPWIAVGVAAAAGFATALAIAAPRSKARERRNFSRERNDNGDAYRQRPSTGIESSILSMLFELARIFMTDHLVPLFQAWQQGLAEQAAQAARGTQSTQTPPENGAAVGEDHQ